MLKILLSLILVWGPLALAKESSIQISKFRMVTSSIYAGGNPMAYDRDLVGLSYLKSLGVATVLSLQGADVDGTVSGWISYQMHHGERPGFVDAERCAVHSMGMNFVNYPIRSREPWGNTDHESVEGALKLLSEATPDQRLYLHCQRGIDRTGLIIALHRIYSENWSPIDAASEWQATGRTAVARWVTKALDKYFCERTLVER